MQGCELNRKSALFDTGLGTLKKVSTWSWKLPCSAHTKIKRELVMESQVMCMSHDQPCDLTPEDQNMLSDNVMVRCCDMPRPGVNTINSLSINSTELSALSHWTTCINKPQLSSRKYTFFFPFLPFDSFPPWSLYTGSGGRLQKP